MGPGKENFPTGTNIAFLSPMISNLFFFFFSVAEPEPGKVENEG